MAQLQNAREGITDDRLCLDFRQHFRAPEQRTAKSGKPAALNANSSQFWKILAFDESIRSVP
jgi:hypothetical protein